MEFKEKNEILELSNCVYLGDDFILLPNEDENTIMMCCVSDGKVDIQTFDMKHPAETDESDTTDSIQNNEYYAEAHFDAADNIIKANWDPFEHQICFDLSFECFNPESEPEELHHKHPSETPEISLNKACALRLTTDQQVEQACEINTKLQELAQLTEKLRSLGVPEELISKAIEPKQKLARLHITDDLRVITPEYGDKEVEMKPLPRALYLLFLNHPEGIAFKNLVDHKEELLQIYNRITNRWQYNLNQKSIDDLVNPTKNSVNEKCSRIRNAFVQMFDQSIARHYYIDGKRGEPKRIDLDRNLVTWENSPIHR